MTTTKDHKQLTLKIDKQVYDTMYELVETAKKIGNKDKHKPTTDNDIRKLLEATLNTKEFDEILKKMKELIETIGLEGIKNGKH